MQPASIDVCICTHNPRLEILKIVIEALASQTFDHSLFRVTIVDNASAPPIPDLVLNALVEAGISSRIIREEMLGIARARLRAIEETDSEWLLFIDDDNEPAYDYIENGVAIIASTPGLGCFGGKLLLPPHIIPPERIKPLYPALALKDCGDEVITNNVTYWGPWEPPTAGAYVNRKVLELFKKKSGELESFFLLGRKGLKSFASCEDSLLMRGAASIGLCSSYQPSLVIYHHINADRFNVLYLLRLMYGFGVSVTRLEMMIDRTNAHLATLYGDKKSLRMTLLRNFVHESRSSVLQALSSFLYHLGSYREYSRIASKGTV